MNKLQTLRMQIKRRCIGGVVAAVLILIVLNATSWSSGRIPNPKHDVYAAEFEYLARNSLGWPFRWFHVFEKADALPQPELTGLTQYAAIDRKSLLVDILVWIFLTGILCAVLALPVLARYHTPEKSTS